MIWPRRSNRVAIIVSTGSERRLRALHLIDTFGRGGAEVLLANTLPALQRVVDVRVRALQPPANLLPDFRAAGVDAAFVDDTARAGGRGLTRLAAALRRELRDHPVDILHTHLFDPTLVGRLARLLQPRGPRLVTTLHNPDYSNPETSSRGHDTARRLLDWASALATNHGLLAVSAAVADDYRHHMGTRGAWGRIEVIHNAIDVQHYIDAAAHVDREAARRQWGWTGAQIGLLSIGRLTLQKNYDTLIEVVRLLRARGLDVHAVVIGAGPYRTEWERAAGTGLRFHGLASHDEVIAALTACDIYVQPSRWEAFGMAILEAMAVGRPVVASAVDGIREVVAAGETGELVAPNVDSLAAAIERLARDRGTRTRWGAAGRARALARFGLDAWVGSTHRYYQRICQG